MPYRAMLLASVGVVGFIGAARAQTGPGPVQTLGAGQSLNNTSNITATSGQAVLVNGAAVSATNSGVIRATGANGLGLQVVSGGSVRTITNSGTIQTTSGGNAIDVQSGGTTIAAGSIGTLTNSGLIQSSGTSSAILVEAGASIASIINSAGGTILATGAGSGIGNGGTINLVLNNGTIAAPSGIGINNVSGGTITGGITNTASGLIQGGPSNGSGTAISNVNGAGPLTINNAGRIVGGIALGPYADRLNVTGGSITGAITGTGTADSLNFALGNGGSFTTGGSISGVGTVGITSGSVNFQNSVAAAQAFSVGSGATAMLNPGAPIGAISFVNAGAVNVGGSAASITGNYTQTSSGALQVTVTNANNGGMQVGQLNVSGTALIQATTNAVAAHVPLTVTVNPLLNQNATLLTAGTLAVSNPAALTASSDNVALYFTLSDVGNTLVLHSQLPTFDQAEAIAEADLDSIFGPVNIFYPPTANDLEAQRFLAAVLAGLSSTGHGDVAEHVLQVLGPPSDLVLAEFRRELQPNSLFSASVNVAMSAGAFGAGASQIEQREQLTLLQDTGLSAGDPVGRGISAWVQPFGSFLTQNSKNGADGYSVNTYGATLGGDTRVTPQLRLGLAITLANQDLTMNGLSSGSKGSTFTAQFGLYGIWHWNDFFVDGLLSYGHNSYSSTIPIPLFGLTKKSDYGGNQFGAKIGGGYNYTLPNRMVITPYVSLEQMHIGFDDYTTSGAYPFNAHVAGQSVDLTQSSLGVRVAYPIKLSVGTLRPEVHTNWFHTFGNTQVTTTYTTADVATPGVFAFTAPSLDRDMFNIGFSATLLQNGPWSFGAGYDFNGRSSSSEHIVYLRAKYNF